MTSTRRELALVVPFYAGLAVLYLWPLPAHLFTRIPGTGDGVSAMWGLYVLTWGIHALANDPLGYFHANVFYPFSEPLAAGDHLLGVSAMMAPVQWTLASPSLTYNLAVLASFVIAGLGAYLLGRQLTGSVRASLLAGLLYGFSTFRFHHLGEINVLGLHWLPWIFLLGHLYSDMRQRRLIYLAGFFTLLQVLSCTYSLYYLTVAAVLAAGAAVVRLAGRPGVPLWRHRLHLAVAFASVLLVLFPFLRPYLNHAVDEMGAHLPGFPAAPGGIQVTGLGALAPMSLMGALLTDPSGLRHPLLPGFVTLFLVGYLAFRVARGDRDEERRFLYYGGVAVAALLLAITFQFRFGGLVSLCLAVMAALGFRCLERSLAAVPRGGVLASALMIVAAVELYPAPVAVYRPLPPAGPPPVYQWIDRTDPELVVAELPAPAENADPTFRDARRQFYSTFHWHDVVDGVAPWVPSLTRSIRGRLAAFPGDEAITQLRTLHVDLVVVHLDDYPPERRESLEKELAARPELQLEHRFEDDLVYRLE